MENKLEIKHLAPYLPHGLKAFHKSGRIEKTCGSLQFIKDEFCHEFVEIEMLLMDRYNYKPILRPLSDLDKFYNGVIRVEQGFKEIKCASDNEFGEFELSDLLEVNEFLFENHFDVFGLIPAGLAIDMKEVEGE